MIGKTFAYSYANARVKAMKTLLLDKSLLEEMVKAAGIPEIISVLERTNYRQDLSALGVKHAGAELVEFALGRSFARDARKIIDITPKQGKQSVLALLEQWDVQNLKTIILAKSLQKGDIEKYLVPAASLKEKDLKRLLEQRDVDELVSFLQGTRYGAALQRSLDEFRKSKDVTPLLNALDLNYLNRLGKSIVPKYEDEKAVKKMVREKIDAKNIMLVLRAKKQGLENVEKFLVSGGTITKDGLQELAAAKDAEAVVMKVKDKFDLSKELEEFRKDGSLSHFESMLERAVAEKAMQRMRTAVQSLAVIAAYLVMKENETSNIRKIVRGKEFLLPEEKIREMLLLN
ncbi:MAG: V-type ATPase subunit [Candidatus Diapherotrites archaeon]